MKQSTRIVLFCLLLISSAWAERLPVQAKQDKISLPFWPAKKAGYGGILLVQGGEAAQWHGLMTQFAKQLARYGWSVVLLNSEQNITIPWVECIPDAITELRKQKNRRIILVHYGEQLNQSLSYFNKLQAKTINGFIMLSAFDSNPLDTQKMNFRFPLYDIAGQFDYDEVLVQRMQRKQDFKHQHYRIAQVPGARHDYEYSETVLLSYLHGWMSKLPASIPQPPPIAISYIVPIAGQQKESAPRAYASGN